MEWTDKVSPSPAQQMTEEQKDLYLSWQQCAARGDLVTGFGQLARLLASAGQGPLLQAVLEQRPTVLQFRESAILYRQAMAVGAEGLADYILMSWKALTPEQLHAQNLARYGEADKGPTTARAEILLRTMNPEAGSALPHGELRPHYMQFVRNTLGFGAAPTLPSPSTRSR